MIRVTTTPEQAGSRPTLSFELFPPRRPAVAEAVWQRVLRLAATRPDFFSVTYGASGSSREASAELVRRLLTATSVPTVAHLTCVGATRAQLAERVRLLLESGVRDFLALRGDPPEGETVWRPYPGGLTRSAELVRLIREVAEEHLGVPATAARSRSRPGGTRGGQCVSVAVAAYPAGRDRRAEVLALEEKQAGGADLAITQVFYDPEDYASLVADARSAGVTIPILPGIIPMTDPARLRRLTALTGVQVPAHVARTVAVEDENARLRRGLAQTVDLIDAVLAAGAPGVHLYTFNQDHPALDLVEQLRRRGLRNPAFDALASGPSSAVPAGTAAPTAARVADAVATH